MRYPGAVPSRAPVQQGNLFPEPQGSLLGGLDEPPPKWFIEEKQCELLTTLRLVQGATGLPWGVLETIHAEQRFLSISRWLPEPEGAVLRALFEPEMARLYAAQIEAEREADEREAGGAEKG